MVWWNLAIVRAVLPMFYKWPVYGIQYIVKSQAQINPEFRQRIISLSQKTNKWRNPTYLEIKGIKVPKKAPGSDKKIESKEKSLKTQVQMQSLLDQGVNLDKTDKPLKSEPSSKTLDELIRLEDEKLIDLGAEFLANCCCGVLTAIAVGIYVYITDFEEKERLQLLADKERLDLHNTEREITELKNLIESQGIKISNLQSEVAFLRKQQKNDVKSQK